MKRDENYKFISKTESLVKPEDVTAISFLGDFNKILSKKTQDKIMKKGSEKIPYMGFIVDPYSVFLSYRIKNRDLAQSMLPEGYKLIETSMFKGDEKHPLLIACAFSARTSAFIGNRLEFYIIARNIKTGLVSWIISDYETNTNSHDPKNGFCGYTCEKSIFTTNHYGDLLVDFKRKGSDKELSFFANLKNCISRKLEESLWLEGNWSVDYGGELKDSSSENFGLIFDPSLMVEAKELTPEKLNISVNSYFKDLIDSKTPLSGAFFPYSQHFIIKQGIKKGEINNISKLNSYIKEFLNIRDFKTMSGSDIKKPIIRGIILSSIFHIGVIIFLLLKLLL